MIIFFSINTLLIAVTLLQLLNMTSSARRPPSPFKWSRRQNCYFHPAEPHISEARCLKFPKESDITPDLENIQNCKWHKNGVCIECQNGYFIDFKTFKDGNLKCSECAKGCSNCKGPRTKDCYHVLPGFKYSPNREKIEGCGVVFTGKTLK